MNLVAQIIGFTALLIYIVSFFKEKRKTILALVLVCNVFYAFQYLMLDAYAALFSCIIGAVRTLIFLKFEKSNQKTPLWVLLIIIAITIYSGFLSYNGFISLIPILSGIMYTISIWQSNLKVYRGACIINGLVWIIYNFVVGAYISIVSSFIEIIAASVSFIKTVKLNKKQI